MNTSSLTYQYQTQSLQTQQNVCKRGNLYMVSEESNLRRWRSAMILQIGDVGDERVNDRLYYFSPTPGITSDQRSGLRDMYGLLVFVFKCKKVRLDMTKI